MVKASLLKSQDVLRELKKRLHLSDKVEIAIAFLSEKGFDAIEPSLIKSLKTGKEINFIVGITDSGVTDAEALERLYRLSEDYDGVFRVGFYNTERFHPKMFLFNKGNTCSAIIGSSNLTGTGLGENIEANILLEGVINEDVFKDTSQYFSVLWDGKDELTASISELYTNRKRRSSKVNKHFPDIPRTKVPPIVGNGKGIGTLGDLLHELEKDYFFMMHLSYKGKEKERLWNFAIQNELIGLQRKSVNDDWAKIRDHIIDKIDGVWIYQFDRFCRCGPRKEEGMDIGDIVIILDGQRFLLGIAQIIGEHKFCGKLKHIFFDHVRPVLWKYELNYEDRLPINQLESFSKTLKRIEQDKNYNEWKILTSVKL